MALTPTRFRFRARKESQVVLTCDFSKGTFLNTLSLLYILHPSSGLPTFKLLKLLGQEPSCH